jgi:hypothetical protein
MPLAAVAAVEKLSVKVSPLTAPVTAPANVGLAAPKTRAAAFAKVASGALFTMRDTVDVAGLA